MRSYQALTDKLAIGLSLLCVVHCFALPLMVLVIPSILALPFADESFHLWMVLIVLPVSAYALTMGCRKHKRIGVTAVGVAGLLLLILSAFLGETVLNEQQEKILTLLGTTIIAIGHFLNFRLCRHADNCSCSGRAEISGG